MSRGRANGWRNHVDYVQRVLGSGLCFASIGLASLFVSTVVFPLIRLTSPDERATRRRVRLCLQVSYRFFIRMASALGVISYEMHGCERLAAPGQLVIANHPSLIDMLLLGSWMPQANCIVKDALLRNPFLRTVVRWADYIPNSAPDHLIRNCVATLRAGDSLLVFPEGTRSVPGQPLSLKRGAAHIALASGCDLLPVTILCHPSALTKTDVWYRVPPHRPHWRVSVGEPIRLADFVQADDSPSRAARRLTAHLTEYFDARIGVTAPPSVVPGAAGVARTTLPSAAA